MTNSEKVNSCERAAHDSRPKIAFKMGMFHFHRRLRPMQKSLKGQLFRGFTPRPTHHVDVWIQFTLLSEHRKVSKFSYPSFHEDDTLLLIVGSGIRKPGS